MQLLGALLPCRAGSIGNYHVGVTFVSLPVVICQLNSGTFFRLCLSPEDEELLRFTRDYEDILSREDVVPKDLEIFLLSEDRGRFFTNSAVDVTEAILLAHDDANAEVLSLLG